MLGAMVGRTDERWIDFNFWGHQITAHLVDASSGPAHNDVDGDAVPARHFGLILSWDEWHKLRDLLVEKNARFLVEPKVRFAGKPGEQATMFLQDPSGNAIELKSFQDEASIFDAG